jgi:hypothetical protein
MSTESFYIPWAVKSEQFRKTPEDLPGPYLAAHLQSSGKYGCLIGKTR